VNGHDYINGYCRICKEMEPGHVVPTTVAPTQPTQAPTEPTQAPTPAPSTPADSTGTGGTNWWPLILIILLGMIGLGVLAFVLFKKK
jgi:hypothetical protein